MKTKTKGRHWIALAVALATMLIGIISFADFFGEPAPKWREVVMMVGPTLTVVLIVMNITLDGRRDGK